MSPEDQHDREPWVRANSFCCPFCGWHLSSHGSSHGRFSDCPNGQSPSARDGSLGRMQAALVHDRTSLRRVKERQTAAYDQRMRELAGGPTGHPEEPRTPWRVGSHYGIHVYAGDQPVATFLAPEDAARAVAAVNGQQRERLVALLHSHRLTSPRQCRCGWRDDSVRFPFTTGHAEHVADALAALLDQTQPTDEEH